VSTPTARALARLRELGYLADVVERRLPRCFITRDLFGCIDVVAVRPGEVLGVQCTSASNLAARLARARGAPGLRDWLAAGARFGVWGWAKRRPRGRRKVWCVLRVTTNMLNDGRALAMLERALRGAVGNTYRA
jgi:hypothetical protein